MKWLNYTSKYAAGVIEAAPKFREHPEKWPIRSNETNAPGYASSRRVEYLLSLEVLGYMKEKRVRNDKVHYSCRQSLDNEGPTEPEVVKAYVIKNDPFLKEMLVSPTVVPLRDGEFIDDQIEKIEVTKISYFQLRPENYKKSSSFRKKRSLTFVDPPSDTDELESATGDSLAEDCSIKSPRVPKSQNECSESNCHNTKRKPLAKIRVIKALNGGPYDPFKNKPNARTDLVCVPVATGVVTRGDTVTILGTTWKVNGLYWHDTKAFIEVEKDHDILFKSTVPINYVQKETEVLSNNSPCMPLYEEYSLVYWAYSNLKHLLMHSFNDKSRIKDIKRDLVPCTPATLHAFGIEEGPVTFSIKEEGPFSTATWDHVLGDQWDKVADGTAVIMTLRFKQDKSCALNFNKSIFVHVTLVSNVNFKTMQGYRLHVKEHC